MADPLRSEEMSVGVREARRVGGVVAEDARVSVKLEEECQRPSRLGCLMEQHLGRGGWLQL